MNPTSHRAPLARRACRTATSLLFLAAGACMSDLSVGVSDGLPDDDYGDSIGARRDAGSRSVIRGDAGSNSSPWYDDDYDAGRKLPPVGRCTEADCDANNSRFSCAGATPLCSINSAGICRWDCGTVVSMVPKAPTDVPGRTGNTGNTGTNGGSTPAAPTGGNRDTPPQNTDPATPSGSGPAITGPSNTGPVAVTPTGPNGPDGDLPPPGPTGGNTTEPDPRITGVQEPSGTPDAGRPLSPLGPNGGMELDAGMPQPEDAGVDAAADASP